MVIVFVVDLFRLAVLSMPKNLRMVLVTDISGPGTGADENSIEGDVINGSLPFVV